MAASGGEFIPLDGFKQLLQLFAQFGAIQLSGNAKRLEPSPNKEDINLRHALGGGSKREKKEAVNGCV